MFFFFFVLFCFVFCLLMFFAHYERKSLLHHTQEYFWIKRKNKYHQMATIPFTCKLDSVPYSLNVNEWKFHSPIEWNSCKPLKKEWFCTLNSKFPLIKSENHSKKSELPFIWGVKRRTTRKRIVLRLTPQTSGNSLFLESFSLYMSGNLLFNVQNHSFLSGLQEFHSFGEWNFHSVYI